MTTAVASTRFAGLSEGLPRAYWFLWAGMLVNRLGSFVMPMLMVYLTSHLGLTLMQAGAVVSLYGLGALAGNTAGGALSDRIGRRATLLLSCVSSAVCLLAMPWAQAMPALMTTVLFLGLTTSMYQPSTQSMIADLVEPKYRIKAFSYSYWAVNLGFSMAALIGGFMAASNFALLFVLDAATTLAFAAIIWRFVAETKPQSTPALTGSVFTPYFDKHFLPFMAFSFVGAFVFMQHLTMLPAAMALKHFEPSDYGIAISVNGLFIVVLQGVASRVIVRGSRPRWFAVASVILGIGFGLNAFADTLAMYAVTVAVWTLAEVILAPLNSSYVSDFAPPSMRGRYQGAYSLTWSLAMLVAPSVSPLVVTATSMEGLWFLCFGLGLFSAAGLWFFTSRAERWLLGRGPVTTARSALPDVRDQTGFVS
jgi:MFS family permease